MKDFFSSRFWSRVDKSSLVIQPYVDSPCWIWVGSKSGKGGRYGSLSENSRSILAHRASYELAYGEFDSSLLVCHHCDVPACVRPEHLFLGTYGDNSLDAKLKGRIGGRKWIQSDNSPELSIPLEEESCLSIKKSAECIYCGGPISIEFAVLSLSRRDPKERDQEVQHCSSACLRGIAQRRRNAEKKKK